MPVTFAPAQVSIPASSHAARLACYAASRPAGSNAERAWRLLCVACTLQCVLLPAMVFEGSCVCVLWLS